MREIFPSLTGNDRLRRGLADDLASDRSAHAYVLEGPRGSGRHTAARLIAASTLCERRGDGTSPLPCGRCLSCRKILGGSSVDVLTVSRGERATLGVEPIRALRDSLYVTPNDGEKKFYLIEDAHLMTVQAQNALLLSLEDPPPYAMFLLLCEDASLLLETIRSRAPVLRMERFSPAFIEKWLRDRVKDAEEERLVMAAHLAGGALGEAMELVRAGDEALDAYRRAKELTRILLTGRRSEGIVFLSELPLQPKDRAALRQILALTRLSLRDCIAERRGAPLLFYGEAEGIPAFAKRVSVRRVLTLVERLEEAENDVAANVTPSVVMTALIANA